MKIDFRKAETSDAATLIEIYNSAFYDDFLAGNRELADRYSFVTVVDGETVGHIS